MHSYKGQAILHPKIKDYLSGEGYKSKSSKDEGNLKVTIAL